jgi:flagellar basal body-associated protein FliL
MNLSIFRVAEGGRRKSLIIFSVIIAVILIIATVATLAFVFIKNDSTTNQKGSE